MRVMLSHSVVTDKGVINEKIAQVEMDHMPAHGDAIVYQQRTYYVDCVIFDLDSREANIVIH